MMRQLCGSIALSALFVLAGCGSDFVPVVSQPADTFSVAGSHATLEVRAAKFRMRLRLSADGELLTEESEDGMYYERDGRRFTLGRVVASQPIAGAPAGSRSFVVETTEGPTAEVQVALSPSRRSFFITLAPPNAESVSAVGARFDSPADEAIYGLTERLRDSRLIGGSEIPLEDVRPPEAGSLNRRGEKVEMFVRPTIALYAPFFHSSRGYGLSVRGTMPGELDIARSDSGVVGFHFENSPRTPGLAFDVFVGPEHADILDEYTRHTGRPFVAPRWAYRHWRWHDEHTEAAPVDLDGVGVQWQVAEDVKMFESLGIPPGVYLFDRPVLQGEFGWARFEWNTAVMHNPAAMIERLLQRGYRLATWSSTWTCGDQPGDNGYEAQQLGYLAPGPMARTHCADIQGGRFILDVTNPAAFNWLKSKLANFLAQNRIEGIKLDRGEEHIPSSADDIWFDGRSGREVHNAYPVLQAQLHYEALREAFPSGDFVMITRSGYTGAQQYGVVWGGDTAGAEFLGVGPGTDLGLRSAIIGQQRAAFMGYPIWGSDTGGYYIFKDREVFARWIEFSAFSGIMEIGGKGNRSPWNMPTEPNYDTEMIEIYRRYTQLRETLLDYIYAAAQEAGRSGMPMARPMVFFDRNDPELRDRWDQYMFGPDLLVAPVWRVGQRSREVYLPRGRWRSYWNPAEEYEGPRTISVDVPLDFIPVYMRAGAVIPR